MSFLHDTYTVIDDPAARGHIVRLRPFGIYLGTVAFHAWNKFTLYLFGWRVFDSRCE